MVETGRKGCVDHHQISQKMFGIITGNSARLQDTVCIPHLSDATTRHDVPHVILRRHAIFSEQTERAFVIPVYSVMQD